jgi:hypothetical protein
MRSRGLVGALFLMLTAVPAFGQSVPAGRIKIASGAAFVVRDSKAIPAQVGLPLFEADTLRTGGDGRLGVTLRDDTRIALGPASEIRLDRFVYAPAESRFGAVLKLIHGVAVYVSGRIAKLAPDSVRLETPAAIVGIRGTTLVLRSE